MDRDYGNLFKRIFYFVLLLYHWENITTFFVIFFILFSFLSIYSIPQYSGTALQEMHADECQMSTEVTGCKNF